MDLLTSLFALVAGLLGGWFISQRKSAANLADEQERTNEALEGEQEARERLAALEAQTVEREKSVEREKEFFAKSLEEMGDKFKVMAQSALKANNDQFLQNTDVKLKPLSDALKALEDKTGELEEKRTKAYASIEEQIKGMKDAAVVMMKSSEQMQTLLKGSSQVRGNWGELLLRNVVEFSGMEEHVHFNEQTATSDGQIPDMIVRLPGGAGIPVDSKCPFDSYELARNESDPEKVRELMTKHAKAVKSHVVELGRRDYSGTVEGDIDFTIMFMPGDHLLEAALAIDPGLQDEAMRKKILITNPVSLVALLRTVRIYWRQEETDRNAQQIADAARTLFERCCTWMEHVGKIGKGLKSSIEAHNKAVGSWQRNIVPAGKRLKDLKLEGTDRKSLDDSKMAPAEITEELRELGE